MKFTIHRTSNSTIEHPKVTYVEYWDDRLISHSSKESAEESFSKNYKIWNSYKDRKDFTLEGTYIKYKRLMKEYVVEIDTLEELIQLKLDFACKLVISENEIEVYDDYRE